MTAKKDTQTLYEKPLITIFYSIKICQSYLLLKYINICLPVSRAPPRPQLINTVWIVTVGHRKTTLSMLLRNLTN